MRFGALFTDMEIEVDADTIDEIALSFKGLNEFQIRQILTVAVSHEEIRL